MNKSFNLLVKFKPETIFQVKEGKLYFVEPEKIVRMASFLFSLKYRLVIPELAKTGELICTENNIDFSSYKGLVYVENAIGMPRQELESLATQFKQLDFVEYAEIEPVESPPPPTLDPVSFITVAQTTPDLTRYQNWLNGDMGANEIGIDARYAWTLGIRGLGVRCADIETGFLFGHEDLAGPNFIPLLRLSDTIYDDHGAAVAGIVFARDNHFGMIGVCPNLDFFYGVSEHTLGRVGGILEGARHLRAGDVFIYQMQATGLSGTEAYVPADFQLSVWNETKRLTDAGIIVVAAAGNGGVNLDDPLYNEYRNRGDNGSIMVGFGTKIGRNHVIGASGGSTYGSPVHVQGWGDWSVATVGYGQLHDGGPLRTYTNSFSGTSSASAIVGAAVASIQSWYKAFSNGAVLSPRAMRDALIRSGTPQGSGGHIGPLPNIRRAIEYLGGDSPLVLSRQEDLSQIGSDPNGQYLHDMLLRHSGVFIQVSDGVWALAIVFPDPARLPNRRFISISTSADWSFTIVVHGESEEFHTGMAARYVIQNHRWVRE